MTQQMINLFCIVGLAAMSPGPDFAILTRQAVSKGFKGAVHTALGFATAIFLHVFLIYMFGHLLSTKVLVYVRAFGALYLIYLSVSIIKSLNKYEFSSITSHQYQPTPISHFKDFTTGFLTNISNPKAIVFLSSLIIGLNTKSELNFISAGLSASTPVFLWFTFLGFIITRKTFLSSAGKVFLWINLFLALFLGITGLIIFKSIF